MSADVITQLETAARVLDRLTPPVTLDELTRPPASNSGTSALGDVDVLDRPEAAPPGPRPLRTVAVIAAAVIVVVGGLSVLSGRDSEVDRASSPSAAVPNGTSQPSTLDPLTRSAIPVGALPDDVVLRFGAQLTDGSEIWVYDSASTRQVCSVRSVGDGHVSGCFDFDTYDAGLTWSLEGTGSSALLWGLTPPSNLVTITIGDTIVTSDANGLWYTTPPADATAFTIATAAGETDFDIVNPQVGTTIPAVDPEAAALLEARSQAYSSVIAGVLSELGLQETATERFDDPFRRITVAAPTDATSSVTVKFTVQLWYPGEYADDAAFHSAVTGSTEVGVPIDGGKLFVVADAAATSEHSKVVVVTPDGAIKIEAAPVPAAPNPRPVADVITVADMTDVARQLTRELPTIAAGTTN